MTSRQYFVTSLLDDSFIIEDSAGGTADLQAFTTAGS